MWMKHGEADRTEQTAEDRTPISCPDAPGTLDYAWAQRRDTTAMAASTSAALCIIGSGVIALPGALMIGLGAIAAANCITGRESMLYGCIVLVVAAGVLVIGLIRWFGN